MSLICISTLSPTTAYLTLSFPIKIYLTIH